MDTIVPSPNLLNTPFPGSPQISIYDQEKQFWGGSKAKNHDINLTDEGGLLDDNFEDSSLKSLLTPELLNSMTSSTSGYTTSYSWGNKYNPDEIQGPSAETPFIPLSTDPDLLFDLLNVDSNDSKFFPALDFDFKSLQSNPSSCCHTPVPQESKLESVDIATVKDSYVHPTKEVLSKDSVGVDFFQKRFPPNFPPRTSQPPIVVVSPVIAEGCRNSNQPEDVKTIELKAPGSYVSSISSQELTELPPQTVPSFGDSALGGFSVKTEPGSPEMILQNGQSKRSADDMLEDAQCFMHGDSLPATKSKRRRCDSGSSDHISDDGEDDDLEDESDDDNSDLDADLAHMKPGGCESLIAVGKKQKQYFWQYNVQAKGPKGTRLKLAVDAPADPHVLNGFEDPVFDEGNTLLAGIRHGGKARKGDGNEVTPNPHKLFKIGHQLLRLNKRINACQLGTDVPQAQRNESRKEKNKLASRACRLKKKAQHEANKIKLHGLEMEHGQINNVLRLIWPELRERAKYLRNHQGIEQKPNPEKGLTSKLTEYISSNLKSMVGGHTTDYVNNVILAVEKGDTKGGLNVKSKKT